MSEVGDLITEGQIIPPKGGWKAQTCYVVNVSYSSGNPVHRAIFYSGFLSKGFEPGSYNQIFNPTYDEDCTRLANVYFLEVIRKLDIEF